MNKPPRKDGWDRFDYGAELRDTTNKILRIADKPLNDEQIKKLAFEVDIPGAISEENFSMGKTASWDWFYFLRYYGPYLEHQTEKITRMVFVSPSKDKESAIFLILNKFTSDVLENFKKKTFINV